MNDVVIKVESLSKLYRYGQSGFSRASLREALTDAARSTVHGPRSTVHGPRSTVHGARSTVHGPRFTTQIPNPICLLRALRALLKPTGFLRGSSPCPSPFPIQNPPALLRALRVLRGSSPCPTPFPIRNRGARRSGPSQICNQRSSPASPPPPPARSSSREVSRA